MGKESGKDDEEEVECKQLNTRETGKHSEKTTENQHCFSKFFRALSGGPGGSRPPFSNSPSHATYTQTFSQLSTSILTSFFTVFDLLMIIQPPHDIHSQTGVTNLWPVTHSWPPLLPTSTFHLQGSGGFLPPTSPLRPPPLRQYRPKGATYYLTALFHC